MPESFDPNSHGAMFSRILARLDVQEAYLRDIASLARSTNEQTIKTNGRVDRLEGDRTRAIDECRQCRKELEERLEDHAKQLQEHRDARIAARWWLAGVAAGASLLGGVAGQKLLGLFGS